jgi:hypothetical protein
MGYQTKFFVHDKTRMVKATTGQEYYDEAIKEGFREVTADEFDSFQVETRSIRPQRAKDRKNAKLGK